jgi:diguanylate cyclase (GGDEF)-like protein
VFRSLVGDEASFGLAPGQAMPLDATICHRLLEARSAAVAADARSDERVRDLVMIDHADVGAYVGVQLRFADGERYGTLCCVAHDPRPGLGDAAVEFLQVVARIVADQLEREQRRAEPEVAFLAYHDALTGLPNRALLAERLEPAMIAAQAAGQALALLYIDLNDFKPVNDALGHAAGDALLCEVAERLRWAIRRDDLLVRQGGDEFLILLAPLGVEPGGDLHAAARAAATACADRVAGALQSPVVVGDAELQVTVSVGASVFPFDAGDAEALHKHADAAMYSAKSSGGGCAIYERGIADPLARLSLAARLRRALEREEFELHYQPIWRVRERVVMGVEALLRWRDPERGLVSPGDFIAVAEQTGVIDALGDWAPGELCRQAVSWSAEGLTPNFGLNVSPRQLRRPGFAERVRRTLDEHGHDPRRFVLEVTESAWTVEAARTLPVIAELRASGLVLALDDFGAGYSSLTRLRDLPVVVIKIDRAFMRGIPDDPQAVAMVTAILRLAGACGCDVVAEGVEHEAQLRFLAERDCRLAQGFHLGHPLPADEITPLLHRRLLPERRGAGVGG